MNDEIRRHAYSSVRIDPLNLDKEILRLPTLYTKYAFQAADLRHRVDQLKAEMDLVEADLDRKVRADPEEYGINRISEGSIHRAVIRRKEYCDIQRLVQNAQHDQEIAQAMVWAMEHKKRSLTLLVELHGLGYMANPKLSEKGKSALHDMMKEKIRTRREVREHDSD